MLIDPATLSARQARSRVALHRALERLIETTSLSRITVSALALEAGVGRPTFYRLYDDVNALLVDCMRVDLEAQLEAAKRVSRAHGTGEAVRRVSSTFAFEAMAARPRLYLALLDGSGGTNAVTIFRTQIAQLMRLFPPPSSRARHVPEELRIGLIASAISGFLLAWLERDRQPPAESAAPMMDALLDAVW